MKPPLATPGTCDGMSVHLHYHLIGTTVYYSHFLTMLAQRCFSGVAGLVLLCVDAPESECHAAISPFWLGQLCHLHDWACNKPRVFFSKQQLLNFL
jgi:hypothetical protein